VPAPEAAIQKETQEAAHESDKAARRRSTVREKVSFLADAPAAAAAPPHTAEAVADQVHAEPAAAAPAPAEPATETTTEAQPRKAGWWSRRFGNGE
jgi:ribonuclease E